MTIDLIFISPLLTPCAVNDVSFGPFLRDRSIVFTRPVKTGESVNGSNSASYFKSAGTP